jgi:hypothetical protein
VTSALDKSVNRDNFIFRRDLQKLRHGGLPAGQILPKAPGHVNGRADAANVYSLNRRAVIKNTQQYENIRLPALQVIKCIMTRHIFTTYKFIPRHAICQPNTFASAHIKN